INDWTGSVYLTEIGIKSFSGWMFNNPSAAQVEAVSVPGFPVLLFMFHNQPFQQEPTPPTSSSVITGGAMADFNLDGYDDFAFSYDDGTIAVATAADVNNSAAGLTLGPSAKLDVLSGARDTAMAAGDFNGGWTTGDCRALHTVERRAETRRVYRG